MTVQTMNNGRDCLHVHRVGDCWQCDYHELDAECEQLKALLVATQQNSMGGRCTGQSPCARHCEAIATSKMLQQAQQSASEWQAKYQELLKLQVTHNRESFFAGVYWAENPKPDEDQTATEAAALHCQKLADVMTGGFYG